MLRWCMLMWWLLVLAVLLLLFEKATAFLNLKQRQHIFQAVTLWSFATFCYSCSCDLPFVLTGAALRTTRRFTTSAAGTWTSNVRPTPTWTDWSPRSSPLWHLDFEWEVSQMMHDEAARKLLDTGTPDYSEVEIMDDISWIWWSQISGHINIEMSDIPFTVLVAYVLSWKSPSQ